MKKRFTVQERINFYEQQIVKLTAELEYAKERYKVLSDEASHKRVLRSWKDIALEHRAKRREGGQ